MMQCEQGTTKNDLPLLLFSINVLSVFIKRYINATLLSETQEVVGENEHKSCLREIAEVLKDANIPLFLCEDIKDMGKIKANHILQMLKCWILLLEYVDFQCESIRMVIKEEEHLIRYEIRMEKQCKSLHCRSDFEEFLNNGKEDIIQKILKITENKKVICVIMKS